MRLEPGDILAPLEKLAGPKGSHFFGREAELEQLRVHVLSPAGSPAELPLMIQGPGGVGKSTLLAKLIIDHVAGEGPHLPFVYLDFDRPGLDAKQPLSLLIEAARQLGAQFPELSEQAEIFSDDVRSAHFKSDDIDAGKSTLSVDAVMQNFVSLLAQLPQPPLPILLVLDTFEEVQFLGEEPIYLVRDLLERLQRSVPTLRIILSGRAELPALPNTPLSLPELDAASARAFVVRHLAQLGKSEPDDKTLDTLIGIVGTNPLSLKLAALLVAREGLAALDNVEARRYFFLKVKAERIQAMLYGRILSHLHRRTSARGEKLCRLAHPGLIVRRLTSDVIEKVLAEPCGVELAGPDEARELFDLFRDEVALVEADPEDPEGGLRQRSDVRRLMLADLGASETIKAGEIDRSAIRYYAARRQEGPIMRAEEIYHRLRLGEDKAVLDPLWTEDVAPRLDGAVNELGPQARLWLSARLGITPDQTLLADADQELWETHAERRIRTFLFSTPSAPEPALKILQERKGRRPASPLYLLEAEALRMLGRPQAAIAVAKIGLNSIAEAQEPALAYAAELERLISLVEESTSNLNAALDGARRAEKLARNGGDQPGFLQAQVAQLRLLRKLGQATSTFENLLNDVNGSLTPDLFSSLRRRPSLLRELTAELGSRNPTVLHLGIEKLGVELANDQKQREFAEILKQWDRETRNGAGGEIALRLGIGSHGRSGSDNRWVDFVRRNNGSRLNQIVRSMLIDFAPSTRTAENFTRIFRASVDSTIMKSAQHTRRPTSLVPPPLSRISHAPRDKTLERQRRPPMAKLPYAQLKEMLMDPSVPDSEIGKYLTARPSDSGPFDPLLVPDPKKVDMTAEGDFDVESAIRWGNAICRWRRQERFRERIKEGVKKPVLVSEGDSWFQFPFLIEDVIDQLDTDFLIWSIDAAGDTCDNMVNRNPEYLQALEDQKKNKVAGFLFSAAGNDVIGEDLQGEPVLGKLLKKHEAGKDAAWHIDQAQLSTILTNLEKDYKNVVSTIRHNPAFGKLPIFIHGYDYAIPGGFPGDNRDPVYAKRDEWLGGPMKKKGIKEPQLQRDIIRILIDALYDMLDRVAGKSDETKVYVINVRGTLQANDWADEIHGTSAGFKKVGKVFKKAIAKAI